MADGYAKYTGLAGSGGGVTSLNSLTGALTLAAGTGITVTPGGSTITIASTSQPAGNYITALTGDGTASGPGSAVFTLATVNSSPGLFGDTSHTVIAQVNAKGLITGLASTAIAIAESQVTNLVSDLAGKQATGNYITALTGDITASGPGSVASTLATVNGNVGSFGTASSTSTFTVNGKGLITAASNTAIALAASAITSGTLATARGGTNLDTSASTGLAKVASGTWSVAPLVNADVSSSAAITRSKLANGGSANSVVYNNGSSVMTDTSTFFFDGTNLGIGTAAPNTVLNTIGNITQDSFAAGSNMQIRRANTSLASPSGITAGNIGSIQFSGYTNAGAYSGVVAAMTAQSVDTFSPTAQGAKLSFLVTPSGTASGITGMTILDSGQVSLPTVGTGLSIAEGTNAKMGTAVLVTGAKVVSTTAVTANSRIQVTSNVDGGTPGWLRVSARTAGTSFTITSSSALDTSTVAWLIIEPS